MNFINKPTETSREYNAGLNGINIKLYADTAYEAITLAKNHFKPSKKNEGLLWIHLASEPVNTL